MRILLALLLLCATARAAIFQNDFTTNAAHFSTQTVILSDGLGGFIGLGTTSTNSFLGHRSGGYSFVRVLDADLSLSDVTANNASTSAHGFLPKLSGNTNNYVSGAGTEQTIPTPTAANNLVVTQYVRMPFTTLTLSGTNVSQLDLSATSAFKLTLTNNAYFGVPTGLPGTNQLQTIQIHLLQDGTGTRTVTMTNSAWLLSGSGASTNAAPTINTNANGVTILTFATSPFSSTLLYGVPTAFAP